MYLVYILQSHNCSYVGMTNDFERRWKQHNCILQGGAKYTKKLSDWTPICIVDGFQTKQEAMQCEWRLKRARGYLKRVKYVSRLFDTAERWTKKSPLIKQQNLRVYALQKYHSLFSFPIYELEWY
jgi:predicted GIY-YIG superfamily endonuclease